MSAHIRSSRTCLPAPAAVLTAKSETYLSCSNFLIKSYHEEIHFSIYFPYKYPFYFHLALFRKHKKQADIRPALCCLLIAELLLPDPVKIPGIRLHSSAAPAKIGMKEECINLFINSEISGTFICSGGGGLLEKDYDC